MNKPPLVSFTNKLPDTEIEPVNLDATDAVNEPSTPNDDVNGDVTTNPKLGETDAVTEPDLISVLINASSVNAERGILLRYVPSAYKNEEEFINTPPLISFTYKLPLISTEPVSCEAIWVL